MHLRLALTLVLIAIAPAALARGDTMQTIMATHVNPAALAFWAAGNDPPDGETPAQASLRWAAALKGAEAMQAWGKVLQQPPFTRSGRWNDDARLMIEVARLGEPVIRAHDAAKAFEMGGRLYDACNECHKLYVPRRGATIPRESPLNPP
ncbi:hypothetical protein [Phenylobacterium sp.]|uniref:hypothetical protein n=1 Tax=Phenylobacterium sp. TaxID=1871053 RepID=UPI0026055346|nr:hypothetical protein [Phenylobacterium sp.]